MAKTQKQKWYDDLEALLDKYPNMKVSAAMLVTQQWMDGIWHRLPKAGKTKVSLIKDVRGRYRLG